MKIMRLALPLLVVLAAACSTTEPTAPRQAVRPGTAPLYSDSTGGGGDGGGTMGSGT